MSKMSDDRSDKSDDSDKSYSEDDYSESGTRSEDDYNSFTDDKGQLIVDSDEEDLDGKDTESENGKASATVAIGGNETEGIPSSSKAEEAGFADPLLIAKPEQPVMVVQPFGAQKPLEVINEVPRKPKSLSIVSWCLKYSLMVFCMFFWFVGGLFASIGGWQVSQTSDYEHLSNFATDPPLMFAALGCLIFIVSSFGVLGAYRENICCLRVYKIFLIIIIVFEVCAGIAGFAFWPETKKLIQVTVKRGIINYYDNTMLQDLIDMIQKDLQCCGSETFDDWDSNWYFRCKNVAAYRSCGVPWSCCVVPKDQELQTNINRQCGNGVRKHYRSRLEGIIYTDGCLQVAFGYFKDNLLLIALLGIIFTLPLFAGIYMALRLVKQIKKQIRAVDPDLYQKMRSEQTINCCLTNVVSDDIV